MDTLFVIILAVSLNGDSSVANLQCGDLIFCHAPDHRHGHSVFIVKKVEESGGGIWDINGGFHNFNDGRIQKIESAVHMSIEALQMYIDGKEDLKRMRRGNR